jgi:rhamnosyl/mannosyltransferase
VDILHIYKDYAPVLGGIENHVRLVAEAQAAAGHNVAVLVTGPHLGTRVVQRNGVRVIYAGRLATVASTPLSVALALQLRRERPEIAHLHYPYPMGDVAYALCGRAKRTVITYHSDVVRQKALLKLYAPVLRRSLARAHAILATSPRYVETSPFLAPIAARCTIVPLGVDPRRYAAPDPASRAAIRARYDRPVLLFVGKLRYYKGVDFLIRAMAAVPGAVAVLVGGGSDTRVAELQTLIASLGLNDQVRLVGEQSEAELLALYQAADVFVLPSIERSEAFGMVQLEAMAAGLPVVSCDVGTGVAWVNQHESTGLVVPPRNPQALAAAINRLLADPALRREMGVAGRERVARHFTQAQMLAAIEAVYRNVLANAAPPL